MICIFKYQSRTNLSNVWAWAKLMTIKSVFLVHVLSKLAENLFRKIVFTTKVQNTDNKDRCFRHF